jgi:deoxyxylulose-5-phosphate synthase
MRRSPNEHSLLSRLNSPAELRRLSREKLPLLADELRQFLKSTYQHRYR